MSIRVNSGTDRISRTANLPNCNSYTHAAWVKRLTTDDGRTRAVLDATDLSFYSAIQWSDVDTFIATCSDINGGLVSAFSPEPATGVWFYVAVTGNAATGITGYWWNVAGVLQDTTNCNPALSWSLVPTVIDCLNSPSGEYCDGLVSYCRLWDVALTQVQLEAEMFSVTPVITSNLNTAFTGVGGSGADVSGNGRNWTLTNTSSDADEPPVVIIDPPTLWVTRSNRRLRDPWPLR